MAKTYICTSCKKKVTLYVTKAVPICTGCGRHMEVVGKDKTA